MQPIEPEVPVAEPVEPARHSWFHKIGNLLFIILCFEVGVFLVVFPWMQYWDHNAIARITPWAREIWDNTFFRGALSGLGFVNIYISLGEVFRLRRPRATGGSLQQG